MKKILIIIILLTVLTGCRKEDKLTCYMIKNQESMVISEEVEVEFIGNKATDLSMDVEAHFNVNTSFLAQTMKTTLINNFKKYETNGAIVEVDTEDNSIEIDIDSVRKKAYGELEDLEKNLIMIETPKLKEVKDTIIDIISSNKQALIPIFNKLAKLYGINFYNVTIDDL